MSPVPVLLLLLLLLALAAVVRPNDLMVDNPQRCVPFVVPFCENIGYSYSAPVFHEFEAYVVELDYWRRFDQVQCSKYMQQFICNAYFPMCQPELAHVGYVGPCRHICEHVRRRCQSLVESFSPYGWPKRVSCDRFVDSKGPSLCMDFNITDEPIDDYLEEYRRTVTLRPVSKENASRSKEDASRSKEDASRSPPAMSSIMCAKMPYPERHIFVNRSDRCALRCDEDMFFTKEQKAIAQVWTKVLSSLCFIATLFTFVTVAICIKQDRFNYPERPVVYLAICYCALSAAYLVRFALNREVVACTTDVATQTKYLALEGLDNASCSIMFLASYFFGLAGAAWWCMLTLSLALATVWHRTHDYVKNYSSYFHMAGLGAPAVVTIVVLVLRWVDADELLGMCYVGNHNPSALLYFVILPHSIILLIGTTFLVLSFAAQIRAKKRSLDARTADQKQPAPATNASRAEKLETSMVRIGLYSVIGFILPSTCVIACNIYEFVNADQWLISSSGNKPAIEIFMLRLFMLFTMGITTVIFIWSRKMLAVWRTPFSRLCCCSFGAYAKAAPPKTSRSLPPTYADSRSLANSSAPPGGEYELVQQDEPLRNPNAFPPHVVVGSVGQPSVHAFSPAHSSSTGVTHSHSHSNANGGANSASSRQLSFAPADNRLYVPYGQFYPHDYAAAPNAFGQQLAAEPPMQVQMQVQMQMAPFHPAVHQAMHMAARPTPADDELLPPTGSYRFAPAQATNGNMQLAVQPNWTTQAAKANANVVAPPPSLVNAQVGNGNANHQYYVQQNDNHTQAQPAALAYKSVKNESVF